MVANIRSFDGIETSRMKTVRQKEDENTVLCYHDEDMMVASSSGVTR